MEHYTVKVLELIFHSIFLSHSSYFYTFCHIIYDVTHFSGDEEEDEKEERKNTSTEEFGFVSGKAIFEIIYMCDVLNAD